MNKQNKGITLIALIIIIIVLLILAGISIATLFGDNGILTKATQAKESTEVGTEEENVKLAVSAALTVGTGKLNTANLQEALDNQFGEGARNNLSGDGPWEYTGKYKVYQIDLSGSFSETEIVADSIVFDVPENYEYEFVAGDNVKAYLVEYEDTQVGNLDVKDLGEVASTSTLDAKSLELADTNDDTIYYEMYFIGTGKIWDSSSWYITNNGNKTYPFGTNMGWANGDGLGNGKALENVVSVKISNGITNCKGFGGSDLKYIYIPSSVVSIDSDAFNWCLSLESITIPESVTRIEEGAFMCCRALKSITIPESVTSIGKSAFQDCYNLTNITIPESVTSIGDWAFYICSGLTSITIPEGVTSIGEYTFCGCRGLTSITIPEGVTSIGKNAFQNCTNLSKVYFKETTAPTFGSSCFTKSSGEKITFYFKNSSVYNSFNTNYYNDSYGERSIDYTW